MANESRPGLRLRVSAAAEKMARSGHPWVFAESVKEQNREGETGELAVIYDRQDRFLAVGLFDPDSPIRVRILKAGKPERIDNAWLQRRIAAAMARRQTMFDSFTTGYRCINGESDGLPGLTADRYENTLALKIYTTAWLPRLQELAGILAAELKEVRYAVLRLSRNIQRQAEERFGVRDGQALFGGSSTGPVIFQENGLRFESDPWRGQKTGFFLDQRENRDAVRHLAAGRALLNLFSFSGGFSVAAAAGGAISAVSLDISEPALAAAQRNFALNCNDADVASCRHKTIRADAFAWLQKGVEEKYNLIVIDPPSLAKRKSERISALEIYGKLIGGSIKRAHEGAIIVACSCSAHVQREEFFGVARGAVKKSGRDFAELLTTGHASDHSATFREGEYLKAIYFKERRAENNR